MTFRILRNSAALAFTASLLALCASAQTGTSAPASPYGGQVVERIIARVNDRIITSSDYNRAEQELDQEERQRGASMQEMSDARRDLLRNLIDQQLWLSKGKQLGITGETELIQRLNEIRKQYHLDSLDALQKAAEQQGVSFEDFKANIRNQIVTQEVMRQEVGQRINVTPGEVRQYFNEHKQDYVEPESVHLEEILISTGSDDADAQKVAAAEAKANDVEAKLHSGGNFAELAKSFSDGPTAASGGDLGTYKRGELAPVFEDKVFNLATGQFTAPIRTKQGFVILGVVQHNAGGVPAYSQVENQAEQAYFMSKMEPATRAYLTQLRDESYVEIAPGYVDAGASPNKRILPISYSSYKPPSPKKKRKIERTRFRETGRGQRRQSAPALELSSDQSGAQSAPAPENQTKKGKKSKEVASEKPGKKEKIRFGRAPQETLPNSPTSQTENAGAMPRKTPPDLVPEGTNPDEAAYEEAAPAQHKTRYSELARTHKDKEKKSEQAKPKDFSGFQPASSTEAADRQQQSTPLGLGDNVVAPKKKESGATNGKKTRFSDEMRKPKDQTPMQPTPIPPVQGAPAPAPAPQSAPQQPQTTPQQPSDPQQ
ncbi:MAG TPA: peptidylprolyl isomerase [Terracidiphilus sp.]|nr:peptidylprolyl isomerase [Terracidiphilus sp.]